MRRLHTFQILANCLFRATWYWEVRAEVEDDASITNLTKNNENNEKITNKFGHAGFKDEVHHVLPNYFYAKECFHTNSFQITGRLRTPGKKNYLEKMSSGQMDASMKTGA